MIMKSSHFFPVVTLFLILLLNLTPAVSAATVGGPDAWSVQQIYYQPYNSTASKNITVQNSTYIVDESGLVPVEWFVFLFVFASIFLLLSLFVENNNDLTALIAAILYYLLAYQGQYLQYHSVIPAMSYDATTVLLIPISEVYHLFYVSMVCLALALIMSLWAVRIYFEHLREAAERKKARMMDLI